MHPAVKRLLAALELADRGDHVHEEGLQHQIPMDEVEPPSGETYERALLRTMTPDAQRDSAEDAVPDDPALHQCLFAYASDYAIMAPIVQPHPVPITALQSASLDHAIWFHRDFRMDDWLLFELDSPVATGARGIGRGLLYSRDGALVASCVQEGLIRPVAAGEVRREIRELWR
jgi:acyl-CoA thioesterase